jgi:hypothetical protein
MAVSILALQRQVTELLVARFLETKLGQALLAILTPIIAAAVKWLMGGS